ncbi:glycosyltransferase family 2 protein [Carnobacteriaceae bacterium zg-ZUI240]|nr:glycosyltransferase family 2 protein [Carnobacteriaceae bacterium zg-ZUI240]
MKLQKAIQKIEYVYDDALYLCVKGALALSIEYDDISIFATSDDEGKQLLDYTLAQKSDAFTLLISVDENFFDNIYIWASFEDKHQLLRCVTEQKQKLLYKKRQRVLGAVDVLEDYGTFVYLSGWGIHPLTAKSVNVSIEQSGVSIPVQSFERTIVRNHIVDTYGNEDYGFIVTFNGEQLNKRKSFSVVLTSENGQTVSLPMRIRQHAKKQFHIDQLHYASGEDTALVQLSGWYIVPTDKDVEMVLQTQSGVELPANITAVERGDLHQQNMVTPFDNAGGFDVRCDVPNDESLVLVFKTSEEQFELPLSIDMMKSFNQTNVMTRVKRAVKSVNKTNIKRAIDYYHIYGLQTTLTKVKQALLHGTHTHNYAAWYDSVQPTPQQLQEQRETVFDYMPKISVVVPTYRTPENYLREMIECVLNQTYANWELCIADGSNDDGEVVKIIDEYAQNDARIVYTVLDENLGISGNTNACLNIATGDFIALFDHDDLLPPQSLFEIVKVLQDTSVDVVYTDEDKIDETSTVHSGPHFKPAFSLELLRSLNYITHFFVVKRTIVDQVGGFRSEFDGAQDFDFILRCCEVANKIEHIGQILYHWRIHSNSTAGNPESKLYAYDAGARAIQSHLKRLGIQGHVENIGFTGYKTTLDPVGNPLVSILIPNKDNIDVLETCVASLFAQKEYTNFEVIIIENNSTETETFDYYEKLKALHDNVQVVVWDGIFNYSAINNFGATFAKGEYLLLLNNDTEMLEPTALRDMVGVAIQDGVGAVGAKLLYPDHTIQHAGVILGIDKVPTHILVNVPDLDKSYRHNALTNYLAVTAACLLTPRKVFDEVGGLSEEFVVAFNDIDYCLKVYERGYRIVNNGFAKWLHYESKSRGYENTPEKIKRFLGEKECFKAKWDSHFPNGDPYYNHELPH